MELIHLLLCLTSSVPPIHCLQSQPSNGSSFHERLRLLFFLVPGKDKIFLTIHNTYWIVHLVTRSDTKGSSILFSFSLVSVSGREYLCIFSLVFCFLEKTLPQKGINKSNSYSQLGWYFHSALSSVLPYYQKGVLLSSERLVYDKFSRRPNTGINAIDSCWPICFCSKAITQYFKILNTFSQME